MAATLPAHADRLESAIDDKTATVGVIGIGYVGLPLAIAFASRGYTTTAFDIDPKKVDMLNEGTSYFAHLDSQPLKDAISQQRFHATTDPGELREQKVIVICVPTPLTPQREPDMGFVLKTAGEIRRHLQPGQLVVLESTTYPGTTDELVRGVLDEAGLSLGQEYFLAYSPEREDPGSRSHSTTTIPKLIGGLDPASTRLAKRLYQQIVPKVHEVSSARVAEAAKLTENIFRAVNIALVNELKIVYDRMGIDIWEVLDAAETKPFGFMRFNPGPGLGGHCIPLDPFYLTWKAREYGPPPKFIELAGEVNVQMPAYVISKLVESLNTRGKPVQGSQILLIGVAYKPDVDDCRESPAFPIMNRLLEMGADVEFHDPHIQQIPSLRQWPHLSGRESLALTPQILQQCAAVLIVTDHTAVDYSLIATHAPLVVDTRGRMPADTASLVRS